MQAVYNGWDMSFVRRIGLVGVLAAILTSILLPAAVVHAQSAPVRPPLSLTTSPLPLNVVTKPGVPVTADIRVKNNGNEPETLKVELLKFGASGDTGRPQLQDRDPKDLYFNWVTFSENNFVAQPNVWKTIKMTINPPKEAAYGYYYAVLFTRANPDHPANGQSAVEGGVASLVLLNVDAPGSRREAKILSLTATHKVYEFLPSDFTVRLRNSGNIHVAPTGTMFIKRGGTQVAAIDFNAERGNILPGTNRVFNMTWNDGFPSYKDVTDKNGKTHKKLVWDFSKIQKFRFGKYTADLVAVYDDGKRDVPIEAVVTFWVIPWRILGVILLIVLIILIGIWGIGRTIWRGIRRQALAPSATTTEPPANSLAAAPKRSRGRPPKAKDETPPPPEKKPGRGRPKKVEKEPETVEAEATTEETSTNEEPPKQTRRGRPPKAKTEDSGEAPVKRGRGRPKKVTEAIVLESIEIPGTRKRGRPPKITAADQKPAAQTGPESAAKPASRRGRPKKEPEA